MDFGVFLPVSGRASSRGGLMHAAQTAEELGFTTVWAADRIVIPWTIETTYNYNWSGSFFVPPEASFLEALTVLSFLAGCTEKLKLGISVLVTPYRDPLYWAKIATTIDQLSEGRLILGFGVGWMEEEFKALGREHLFKARGRVADEQLAILRNLLTEEHCSFQGEFFSYDDIAFQPKSYDPDRRCRSGSAARRRSRSAAPGASATAGSRTSRGSRRRPCARSTTSSAGPRRSTAATPTTCA